MAIELDTFQRWLRMRRAYFGLLKLEKEVKLIREIENNYERIKRQEVEI